MVCGDIHIEDLPFGSYTAMWLTDKQEGLNLSIEVVSTTSGIMEIGLEIGLKCPVGNFKELHPVNRDDYPWEGVEGIFTEPDDYKSYTLAEKAFDVAKELIRTDENISRYING